MNNNRLLYGKSEISQIVGDTLTSHGRCTRCRAELADDDTIGVVSSGEVLIAEVLEEHLVVAVSIPAESHAESGSGTGGDRGGIVAVARADAVGTHQTTQGQRGTALGNFTRCVACGNEVLVLDTRVGEQLDVALLQQALDEVGTVIASLMTPYLVYGVHQSFRCSKRL